MATVKGFKFLLCFILFFGQQKFLAAQNIFPQKAFGLEVTYGLNGGFEIKDAKKFDPEVFFNRSQFFEISPAIEVIYRRIQWNHSLRMSFNTLNIDCNLPYFGWETIEAINTTKFRYQTSLWYHIRLSKHLRAGPEIGIGLSYDWELIGPAISGTAGDGHLHEFLATVKPENGDEELVLFGYAGISPDFHPYFVPGLKFQYDFSRRWFVQMRVNYEISGSEWISESYIYYAPTGAESTLSYKEGGTFNTCLAVFLRGPFGKRRR